MRRQRDATIEARLGNPERRVQIAIAPSGGDTDKQFAKRSEDRPGGPIEPTSTAPHDVDYLAAVITPLGVRPIRDEDDLQAAQEIRERVAVTREPAMIFGLADTEPQSSKTAELPWLSGSGIVSPDGLALFNLRDAELS